MVYTKNLINLVLNLSVKSSLATGGATEKYCYTAGTAKEPFVYRKYILHTEAFVKFLTGPFYSRHRWMCCGIVPVSLLTFSCPGLNL